MPINTTSEISYRTQGYCRARFLEEGQLAGMVFERFGQADPQPKNESKTAKWRRIHNLPISQAKAALAEGITPSGTRITYEDVSGVLEQIGAWIPLTDVLLDTHEDNKNRRFINHLMKQCGRQAAEVKEERRADVLKAGSNVIYAGGVTARASVAAGVARNDFRSVERFFMRNRARKITSVIRASADYGTSAIEPAFIAVAHPDLADTFRDMDGFVTWVEYADSTKRLPGEIGAVEGFRILCHDVVKPWLASGSNGATTYLSNGVASSGSNAYDVYPIICLAEDAYGIVPLQGMDNVEILVRNPKAEKGNELAQEGSIGWKGWDLTVRLNESFMARIECCAKAL
jgi:N4-gp56 family major capsid protein